MKSRSTQKEHEKKGPYHQCRILLVHFINAPLTVLCKYLIPGLYILPMA